MIEMTSQIESQHQSTIKTYDMQIKDMQTKLANKESELITLTEDVEVINKQK